MDEFRGLFNEYGVNRFTGALAGASEFLFELTRDGGADG